MRILPDSINRLLAGINYISLRKLLNFFGLAKSYILSERMHSDKRKLSPSFVSVEVSSYCNLHCPECPLGNGKSVSNKPLFMDFSSYRSFIDNQKETLLHVILYFQGEPFLNPVLPEFIRYAHRAGIYTSTSTNGQLLSKKSAKEIVLSGLDKLIVSVDGATQEVYESYRVGGVLQKALDGITEIIRFKRELGLSSPLVEMQFLVLKTNEHQLKDIKRLAKETGVDKLTFKSAQLYDFENGNSLLTSIRKYARYKKDAKGEYVIKNKLPNRCFRLWSGAVIDADGEVLPCCFDKNSAHSFGNIRQSSFADCWHSKKASGFRERILQNRKQFDMCRNCTGK